MPFASSTLHTFGAARRSKERNRPQPERASTEPDHLVPFWNQRLIRKKRLVARGCKSLQPSTPTLSPPPPSPGHQNQPARVLQLARLGLESPVGKVGVPGFEPGTFGPPDRRANQAAPHPVEIVWPRIGPSVAPFRSTMRSASSPPD